MEKYVIANCTLGLCNRLKCLISAMRLADKLSRTLLLCWDKDSDLNCDFSDLFENKIIEITHEELRAIRNSEDMHEKYVIISTWRLLPLEEDILPRNFSRAFWSETGKHIDLEYNRIPLAIREKFLVYVNKIIPNRYIAEQVKNFSENFNNDTVSVSIRSWVDAAPRDSLFSFSSIYAILDKVKNAKFFVCCDDKEIQEKIVNKYGKRVIFYPKRTHAGDRNTVEGIQDALCELLLLSKNKKLIASYLSTFSEMGWWLGGCEAKVTIIPPKTYLFKMMIDRHNNVVVCIVWKWYKSINPNYVINASRLIKRIFKYLFKKINQSFNPKK